jgi:hypothetical protein
MQNHIHRRFGPLAKGRPDRPFLGERQDHCPQPLTKRLTPDFLRSDSKSAVAIDAHGLIFDPTGDRMKLFRAIVISALIPISAFAEGALKADEPAMIRPAGESDLSEFLWINRPLLVFSDSPADPRFSEQLDLLSEGMAMLMDRDVVVLTDTDPNAKSPVRIKLRPRGFALVLLGKDGEVIFRKPSPWTVREITRSIDKLPAREREIRERRGDG